MKRQEAIRVLTGRLRSSRVRHSAGFDSGQMQITMGFDAVDAPDHCIEACIWFYEDAMEARCYYSALGADICRKSAQINGLLRLLNFINARVFLRCCDGGRMLYSPHILYTPRIYLTANGCFDITITTIIPYDFLDLAPPETLDYITAYCPELLDRLAPPIYRVLLGKETVEGAISYIEREILESQTHHRRKAGQHAAVNICDRRHRNGEELVHPAELPTKQI